MRIAARTPLASRYLTHVKVKTLIAIAGIAFAIILIFLQLGFYSTVSASAVMIFRQLNFDLVVVSKNYNHLNRAGTFPLRYLKLIDSRPGLSSVAPLYLGKNSWRNRDTRLRPYMFIMGYRLTDRVFSSIDNSEADRLLQEPDTGLMDRLSSSIMGPIEVGLRTEVGGRRIDIAGTYAGGTGYVADGAVIVSQTTFKGIFGQRSLQDISLGLIQLAPGRDPEETRDAVRPDFPQDVAIYTRAEIEAMEQRHWYRNTATGIIVGSGVILGITIGTIIIYQILASSILQYLSDYATLKALGYSSSFITLVVLRQALYLVAAAFLPALLLALRLYALTRQRANIPISMTPARILLVALLVAAMSVFASVLALRKVRMADPAELF